MSDPIKRAREALESACTSNTRTRPDQTVVPHRFDTVKRIVLSVLEEMDGGMTISELIEAISEAKP